MPEWKNEAIDYYEKRGLTLMNIFTPQMRIYTVGFNTKRMEYEAEILEIPSERGSNQSEALNKILECEGIDIVDYNDDIAVIVDDHGMLKSGNPVFEIITEDGYKLKLCGKLIFARNDYKEDSVDLAGLSLGDIEKLKNSLNIKLTGLLK
ncbi:DUF3846 domain-containing protein [Domibacillus indicus]|uniref:DUF3846 domain-containing protein n=1 Tax=Domibacillus indicus TaxID=1437523 RepID=UPI000A59301E|nr:hypothetical protein [Domibacillus indicus]